MSSSKIIAASKIFTGKEWLTEHAIVTEKTIVKEIVTQSSIGTGTAVESFKNSMLVPAFIDLQLYGAYEKLLAVYPDSESLLKIKEYGLNGGAAYSCPTVATNSTETFHQCIDAIRQYWKEGGTGILGLHIEGPWINIEKRGAHAIEFIHSPSVEEVRKLLNYGKDVIKIITLAPEVCSKEVIDLILSHNIIISAGHSNATYQEAMDGFKNGISCATHLYNAMSPLQHRAPGLVGATMDHGRVMTSIIPDGYHVDYAAIRIAKEVMKQRLFAITDTVAETNKGLYLHHLEGDKYVSKGILSGSALNMVKALQNLVNHVGVNLDEALRMCSAYPAKAIKLEKTIGFIEKGFKASFTILDEKLSVQKVITDY
jgi:N-acetylglucosamine-6-phosphate deacetylase